MASSERDRAKHPGIGQLALQLKQSLATRTPKKAPFDELHTVGDAALFCKQHASSEDHRAYLQAKRLFDVVASAGALAVGFVPSVVLAAIIAVDIKGNPLYLQTRVGQDGVPFRIVKFRTMVADAHDVGKYFNAEQMEAWLHEVKVENDPRTTKLGAFLRAASIDEFPQFANVLLGQMSVVGPRPITFEELDYFAEDAAELVSCKPGITGLWQTGPRNKATFESGDRQRFELLYVRNACLRLDAALVLRTFKTIAKRTGL